MTTDEINEYLVQQIFSTDGKSEIKLMRIFSDADENMRRKLLERYIYFKAYVMDQITREVTMSHSVFQEYSCHLHAAYGVYLEEHKDKLLEQGLCPIMSQLYVMIDRFGQTGYDVKKCCHFLLADIIDEGQLDLARRKKICHLLAQTATDLKVGVTEHQEGAVVHGKGFAVIALIAVIGLLGAIYFL